MGVLRRTFLATVEALANALEANDEHTSTHARWITDLALKVGDELGLGSHARKRLELGALFHDIGKIGVPAEILSKTGPLTAEERAIVADLEDGRGSRTLRGLSMQPETRIFSPDDRLFAALYATDIAIKSGRVEDEETALMLCVLDLCGVRGASMDELVETIPAPRRR